MADTAKLLKQAAAAYQAGDKLKARELLLELVSIDEGNEKAWLLLSAVVDTVEDRQIALENVLSINPNNEKAIKGLALIEQKLDKLKPKKPVGGEGWSSIDTANAPDTPLGDGWEAYLSPQQSAAPTLPPTPATPAPEPPADTSGKGKRLKDALSKGLGKTSSLSPEIPSSVEWGQESAPATAGSGRSVPQPSEGEYDDWITNLNLKKDEPASAPAADSGWGDIDTSAIFGGGSSKASSGAPASDPFAASPPPASAEDSGWSGWGDFSSATSDAPTAEPSAPVGNDWGFVSPPAEIPASDDWSFASPGDSPASSGSGWGDFGTPATEAPAASSSGWGDFGSSASPFGGFDEPEIEEPPKPAKASKAVDAPAEKGWGKLSTGSFSPPLFDEQPNAPASSAKAPAPKPNMSFGSASPFDDDEEEYYDEDEAPSYTSGYANYGTFLPDDDEQPVATKKGGKEAKVKEAKVKESKAKAPHPGAKYLRQIPPEIEVPPKAPIMIYLGIVLLLALNAGAAFFLVSNM